MSAVRPSGLFKAKATSGGRCASCEQPERTEGLTFEKDQAKQPSEEGSQVFAPEFQPAKQTAFVLMLLEQT